MASSEKSRICRTCGEALSPSDLACPLCSGLWEGWSLRFSPLALEDGCIGISDWIASLPHPAVLQFAASSDGLQVRLFLKPGAGRAAAAAWSALTRQQSRWVRIDDVLPVPRSAHALRSPAVLPVLAMSPGDPLLSLGGALISLSRLAGCSSSLMFCVLGREDRLQARLQALSAYATGTEKGVEDDTPNPWSLRLRLWRVLMAAGGLLAALGGGAVLPGWAPSSVGSLLVLAGSLLFTGGFAGTQRWMALRSVPMAVLEARVEGALLRTSIVLDAEAPGKLRLLTGLQRWVPIDDLWPHIRAHAFPLPASDIASLIAPLEAGEGGGVLESVSFQDVPAAPPSTALTGAPEPIGFSTATGEPVGVDSSGHLLVTGGSRSGKSSAVFGLLRDRLQHPASAPGLFLVDPHGSLADAFLDHLDRLPQEDRSLAIERLRILSPSMGALMPLNLLTLPDFEQAGSALVQAGQRIWSDFWGPRMQAALLALCRLLHAWNRRHPDETLGLAHAAFAAFNPAWRAQAAAYIDPEQRSSTMALDALLGQSGGLSPGNRRWTTEVVSPILSKMMSLELSPWLFASLHQSRFIDLENWIRDRSWIVLRLPAGEIGREGARLTAAVVYNIFEAAFRRATSTRPIPFDFIIDETQEIAAGMQLENLLAEGGKFGARLAVLAQSLALLRELDGFEALVPSLLANSSAQLFFSPGAEDAELIRQTLSLEARYGPTTIDIPSLQAWLRARIDGRWAPPTLIKVDPLPRADPDRVRRVIEDVIAAHPGDYVKAEGREERVNAAMERIKPSGGRNEPPGSPRDDPRRLGF